MDDQIIEITEEVPSEQEQPAAEPEVPAEEPTVYEEEQQEAPVEEEAALPGIEERLAALEEKLALQSEMLLQREQDRALRQHFSGLEKQADEMRESFPDFDLKAALSDPVFVRLPSPMVGLSVEDAYFALHHREITEAGARAAAEMLGNSVKAGKAMPKENGTVVRESPQGGFRPLRELPQEERKLRMDLIRSGKLRF